MSGEFENWQTTPKHKNPRWSSYLNHAALLRMVAREDAQMTKADKAQGKQK